MDDMYYICIMKKYGIAPYAKDEAVLREYVRYYKLKHPVIYRVNDKQRKGFAKKYLSEEVREQVQGLYCTDSDFDMVIDVMDSNIDIFYNTLKEIRDKLKVFRGEEATKLRKQITAFLKERVKNPELSIDMDDPVNILIEKTDVKKFFKRIIRGRVRQLKRYGYNW